VVRLERYTVQLQVFEGVCQLQQLHLGIQPGAVVLRGEPGVSQLDCSVCQVEVGKTRASDDAIFGL